MGVMRRKAFQKNLVSFFMYREIFEKYREAFGPFPAARRPRIGSVIKTLRIDKGIRQPDFARSVQLAVPTLKNIENDHQQATSAQNLERAARALGVTVKDLVLMGREWDPANYFALKGRAPQKIEGIRIRKRAPIEWHEALHIPFEDFELAPISAPLNTKKDFFCARLTLPPKRAVQKLALPVPRPVIGFLTEGFNLKITSGGREYPLTSKQAFGLDGSVPHGIRNGDEDQPAVLYLMTQLPNYEKPGGYSHAPKKIPGHLNIARAIEELRKNCSSRPGRPIPLAHLADLTDRLDYQQVIKVSRLKKSSAIVSWDKIEDILGGAGIDMEDFLEWAFNGMPDKIRFATAATRANTEYLTEGVRIYHATPPGTGNRLFCGELYIEGKKSKSWKRRDAAMCALYLEQGELEVTVGGKIRGPLPLAKGESIYFDASLGFILRNPVATQAKAFLASFPALQI